MVSIIDVVFLFNFILKIHGIEHKPCEDNFELLEPPQPKVGVKADRACLRFVKGVDFNISGDNAKRLCGEWNYWPIFKTKEKLVSFIAWLLKYVQNDKEIRFWIGGISENLAMYWAPNEPNLDEEYACAYAVIRPEEPEERRLLCYSSRCDLFLIKPYFICESIYNECHDCGSCIHGPCDADSKGGRIGYVGCTIQIVATLVLKLILK